MIYNEKYLFFFILDNKEQMFWESINIVILLIIIYIFYIKRHTFNLTTSGELLPIKEEFNITYLDMTQGSSPYYKPPLYTFDYPIVTQSEVYMATGVKEQTYHIFGKTLQNKLPINIENTSGTVENINMIIDQSVDFCICQEDILMDALHGNMPYKREHRELSFICGLFYEYFILLVNHGKNITKWQDLKGKKVGFTGKKSGAFQNGLKLAKASGLEPGVDFAYKNVESTNRLMNLLQNGEFDAVYITSTTKNPYLINICKNLNIKPIGTNGIEDHVIKTYFPHARKKYLNTNAFQDVLESTKFIDTFAVRAVLAAHYKSDETNIYNITKNVFNNVSYFKDTMDKYMFSRYKNNKLIDSFLPSDMFDVHFSLPIHIGAKKYYEEIGFIKYQKN